MKPESDRSSPKEAGEATGMPGTRSTFQGPWAASNSLVSNS